MKIPAFVLAALLALCIVATTTASATGPVAELDGFECGILDANGNAVAASSSHVFAAHVHRPR
jgi:hypothetical protein